MKNLFLASIASIVAATEDEWPGSTKCRAVAFSGGGSHGAYEAGVLYGFVKNAKNKKDFQYDVVSGVSAGAINSLLSGTWNIGAEDDMVDWMSDVWANLTTPQTYVDWKPFGIVTGVADYSGAWNDTPGLVFGEETYKSQGSELHRRFAVACVDVNDG